MSEAGPVSSGRKFSDGGITLLALVVALVLGVVISWTGHAGARRAALAVQPIGALWINAIRMTVIPLVVSLLVTGISSMAGVGGLGRVGVRSLVVFVVLLAGSAAASLLVAVPLFGLFPDALVGQASLPIGAAAAAAELTRATPSGVVAFVLSMIPSNPVAAAAEGNMVAVVVFTAALAVAVSRGSAEARAPLEGFFRSLADAMTRLVGWIVSLAPVAVFCLALPLTVQSGGSLVGAVGFYVVAMAITCAVVTALCYPVAASGIRAFGRAMLPTQLIAASCSSSIASLPAMVRSADALAVPTRISGFVLPLAVSVFKPAAPVAWIVGALFIGKFYGVELGVRELGVVALASVFVSFAAPGVPRGAFLLLTPLFEAIGLPAEGIGVLIAVDLIPDMCATVVQVTGDVTATTVIARLEQRD